MYDDGDNSGWWAAFVILLFVVGTIVACIVFGITDPAGAQRTLIEAGYTDIVTGDYAPFACSNDDWYHTKFKAKNPQGKPVEGVVCRGMWLKASTIRFE